MLAVLLQVQARLVDIVKLNANGINFDLEVKGGGVTDLAARP